MGYSVDMFVNISDSDKPELTCSICQDIFKDPVITNCCLQTFCKECINNWLKYNNTCPFDREKLTSSQISRPPRQFINLLGKLELKCDNYRNGCKDILRLENFETHLLNCKFKECNICHCLVTANHNCVESLLELNRKLENERDNFLKTISQMAESESNLKIELDELRQDYLELIECNKRFQKQTKADLKSKNAKGDTEKVPTKVINSYKDWYEHLDELYKIGLRKNEMLRSNQTGLGGNLPIPYASLPLDMPLDSATGILYPNLHREQTGQQHGEIGAQASGSVHSTVHKMERARTRSQKL